MREREREGANEREWRERGEREREVREREKREREREWKDTGESQKARATLFSREYHVMRTEMREIETLFRNLPVDQ